MGSLAEAVTVDLDPVYVVEGSEWLGRWRLRRFQEEVADRLSRGKDTLLVAPTGAGKTLTLLLAEEGSVGLYPNNVLLLDQQRSVDRILREALGARLAAAPYQAEVDSRLVDVVRVYEVPEDACRRGGPGVCGHRRVALVLFSGRYIVAPQGPGGEPKRLVLREEVARRVCGPDTYTVVLATPDAVLLLMTGLYRDFERAGKALHNLLLASLEGLDLHRALSRTQVGTVGEYVVMAESRTCLLEKPWFIDEYHLYGIYEASILLPALHAYRDYSGWEEPLVFSSATPTGRLHERVTSEYKPGVVEAAVSTRSGALVRGRTRVEFVPVETRGRGLPAWIRVGDRVPGLVEERIGEVKETVGRGLSAFIIVDKVNQIPPIVDVLQAHGIEPECSATVTPPGCVGEGRVVVGSESLSQGIDRRDVAYGIVAAYHWASFIQRLGRIGRGIDSTVVAPVPPTPLAERGPSKERMELGEFVEAVQSLYPSPDLDPHRWVEEIVWERSRLSEAAAAAAITRPAGVDTSPGDYVAPGEAARILDLVMGPPEVLAHSIKYRSVAFTVMVSVEGAPPREADIGVVLRNFRVTGVEEYQGPEGRRPLLRVSLEPGRAVLVLYRDPAASGVRAVERLLESLYVARGRRPLLTTLGYLARLGYRLRVRSEQEEGTVDYELPIVGEARNQLVAVASVSDELAWYLAYTVNAALVAEGERMNMVALLL